MKPFVAFRLQPGGRGERSIQEYQCVGTRETLTEFRPDQGGGLKSVKDSSCPALSLVLDRAESAGPAAPFVQPTAVPGGGPPHRSFWRLPSDLPTPTNPGVITRAACSRSWKRLLPSWLIQRLISCSILPGAACMHVGKLEQA